MSCAYSGDLQWDIKGDATTAGLILLFGFQPEKADKSASQTIKHEN